MTQLEGDHHPAQLRHQPTSGRARTGAAVATPTPSWNCTGTLRAVGSSSIRQRCGGGGGVAEGEDWGYSLLRDSLLAKTVHVSVTYV